MTLFMNGENVIYVTSRDRVKNIIPNNDVYLIQIIDDSEEFPVVRKGYSDILKLSFYDLEDHRDLPPNLKLFEVEDAKKVFKFFQNIQSEPCKLVIHCHAGVSRSAAIALSFSWFLKDECLEEQILKSRYVAPNAQVLEKMASVLDLNKKDIVKKYSRIEDEIVEFSEGENSYF